MSLVSSSILSPNRFAIFAVFSLAVSAWGEDGFSRYQVILQRMPFGDAPPPPTVVDSPAVPPSESFAKNLRICSITQPEGQPVKVGLVDSQSQASFVLQVGEEVDGISLVSADLDEEEAVLKKGAEIVLIKLAAGQGQSLNQQQMAQRLAQSSAQDNQAASYQERRRQRREARLAEARRLARERLEERKRREELAVSQSPRFTGEELRQHLQEYNMEVIRQGLPPLPLELTPEQDAALVAEGILPPNPNAPGSPPTLPPDVGELPVDELTPPDFDLFEELLEEEPP